jgi:hypothetical protein
MRYSYSFGTGFNLGPFRKNMMARLSRAALTATDKAATGAQNDIRNAMRGQRLGGLANAVKQTSDLKKGRVKLTGDGGFSASGIVYAHIRSDRTAGALTAYTEGAIIVPNKGRWLAIATNEIPKRVGRYRMTPQRYVEAGLESRIGPLKFVPGKRHAGEAFLVVDNVTISGKQGKVRRLPKSGRARSGRSHVGIVAFVLIKATRRTKRVDVLAIAQKWQLRVPRLLEQAMR